MKGRRMGGAAGEAGLLFAAGSPALPSSQRWCCMRTLGELGPVPPDEEGQVGQHGRLEGNHIGGVQPELCREEAGGRGCLGEQLHGKPLLPKQHTRAQHSAVHSLRVTRWKRSGGTHLAALPPSAAASLSISLGGRERPGRDKQSDEAAAQGLLASGSTAFQSGAAGGFCSRRTRLFAPPCPHLHSS